MTMTREKFRSRYEELKQIVSGKGNAIAERAGCDETRFINAIAGRIKSEELLIPLYSAMEEVAREEVNKIQI